MTEIYTGDHKDPFTELGKQTYPYEILHVGSAIVNHEISDWVNWLIPMPEENLAIAEAPDTLRGRAYWIRFKHVTDFTAFSLKFG